MSRARGPGPANTKPRGERILEIGSTPTAGELLGNGELGNTKKRENMDSAIYSSLVLSTVIHSYSFCMTATFQHCPPLCSGLDILLCKE